MPKQETLIDASAAASGSAVVYLQGASDFAIRFGASASSYTYIIRATLTENESLSTGSIVVGPITGATGSTLLEYTDKQFYALAISYSAMSGGGSMSVWFNSGEIET